MVLYTIGDRQFDCSNHHFLLLLYPHFFPQFQQKKRKKTEMYALIVTEWVSHFIHTRNDWKWKQQKSHRQNKKYCTLLQCVLCVPSLDALCVLCICRAQLNTHGRHWHWFYFFFLLSICFRFVYWALVCVCATNSINADNWNAYVHRWRRASNGRQCDAMTLSQTMFYQMSLTEKLLTITLQSAVYESLCAHVNNHCDPHSDKRPSPMCICATQSWIDVLNRNGKTISNRNRMFAVR